MHLKGKHALVTGGGTGIGLAIARSLVEDGAEVTITGRRAEVLEKVAAETPGLHPLVMDVRDEDSIVQGVADAVAARGPIQICIANAGVAEGRALHNTDMDFWNNMIATNLTGAFLTIRESFNSMFQTDWGRVIIISSIAGVRGLKGGMAYSATKHGVIGMMRALSEDYLGTPFTFNAICPGYVETDIITRNVESIKDRAGVSEEQALKIMVSANRHKRLIAPEEISKAARWLCGPGSGSVNGQTIKIAGGDI
ncbi:SDR family NAD(P)-dependent oxidoreductase [Shimia aestuarii]|uniref:NAD(P)-dependent dehydrogenase, short-chain alcohol dehydrogenase family n=1 Tax=Shimia aestuarii TaxID=254406 RepID=A0A1I4LRC1_9RHOB|nr:SDR family NAD(P)-dependent oxidoreductase [Shimia aestuarii]SFL93638.1 NAD(P)-dependent dehydrogenase, short-chain alcohol dehydrogenase family [Shimia aestuarii]